MNMHFHTHSDHAVDGSYYPMEMHMVHRIHERNRDHTNDTRLVISLLFNIGDQENAMLKAFKLDSLEVNNAFLHSVGNERDAR